MVKLKFLLKDDHFFEEEEDVFSDMNTIMNLFLDCGESIPLPNIKKRIFKKIVIFSKITTEYGESNVLKNIHYNFFLRNCNTREITKMIIAANFLEYEYMLNILKNWVSQLISTKSIDDIKTMFHIKDDLLTQQKNIILEETEIFA